MVLLAESEHLELSRSNTQCEFVSVCQRERERKEVRGGEKILVSVDCLRPQ